MSLQTSMPKIESPPAAGNKKPAEAVGRGSVFFHARARKVRNRITVDGVLFIGLVLVIGAAAVNTAYNILYLVLSMMLAILIVSGLMARRNLRRLTLLRLYPNEFHAGQTVTGRIEIHNRKRRAHSYALRFSDEIAGPDDAPSPQIRPLYAYALMAAPRSKSQATVSISLPQRGLYHLKNARISSSYPFGFFERSHLHPQSGKLLVLPRLYSPLLVLQHCGRALGDLTTDRKGDGASIYGIRDYQSGDPARMIHWKQSAKGQGLKVKEFERDESRSFHLLIDLRMNNPMSEAALGEFEKALSVTATLARYLLQNEAQVSLFTTRGTIPLGSGPGHLMRIYRALAQVAPQSPADEILFPEPGAASTPIWIEHQPSGSLPEGSMVIFNRLAGSHAIDVRKIPLEPNHA